MMTLPCDDYRKLNMISGEKKSENNLFHEFLKQFSGAQIDQVFLPIAGEVTRQTDCTQCGNCCRELEPGISAEEAGRMATLKRMATEAFTREFTRQEPGTGLLFMSHLPCIFFDGHLCTIYEDRPLSCRDFPHLERGNFKFRFRSILANYSICPIVFNSVELLKRALKFKEWKS